MIRARRGRLSKTGMALEFFARCAELLESCFASASASDPPKSESILWVFYT